VLESKLLRRVFGPEKEEATEMEKGTLIKDFINVPLHKM
jgi:hypothetical protein